MASENQTAGAGNTGGSKGIHAATLNGSQNAPNAAATQGKFDDARLLSLDALAELGETARVIRAGHRRLRLCRSASMCSS